MKVALVNFRTLEDGELSFTSSKEYKRSIYNLVVRHGLVVSRYEKVTDLMSEWRLKEWKTDGWDGVGNSCDFVCGVLGCKNQAECKGFCKKHWSRFLKNGIVGDDGRTRLPNGLYTKRKREYKSYDMMKQRCYNKNNTSYKHYGARGIKVCDRWLERPNGFKNFLEDMGSRPDGCSLDRIDVDGDYCPENCRWADNSVQMHNRQPFEHTTKHTGVGFYRCRNVLEYRAYIAKNGEFRQKTFDNFEDALLCRAKWEEELYDGVNRDLYKLIVLVKDWGRQKGINNIPIQLLKCQEELMEVWNAIYKKEPRENVKLELGDCVVTLIILADLLGIDLDEAVEKAFNKIKVRTGKTINGNFIKQEDLNA